MKLAVGVLIVLALTGCASSPSHTGSANCERIVTKDSGYLNVCEANGIVRISTPDGSPLPDYIAYDEAPIIN